ncbi:hypothetical protein GGI05_004799, partial [Coemansia sp. RSA 2603]
MDGVDGAAGDGGVLVVAATNRIDLVDNALLRPGRFDRVLYVPPPDECARGDILRARLAGMPQDAAAAVDVAALARRTCGFSGADLANLCREAAMVALRRGVQRGAAGVAAVAMDDFERALGVVQPSLTADVLRFYAGIEREYLRQALHQTLSVGPDHGAVLALAQTRDLLIAGTQRGDILAWSRTTFRRTHAAQGAHAAGCLSLALDSAQHVLFSGGGDGRVRAWDARTLAPLYTVHAGENAGGVLALAYFGRLDALALGCQNASVQWFDVGRRRAMVGDELAERRSRFFDARADSGSASPDPSGPAYVVDERCIAAYAHSGYVYCALAGQLADGRAALFTAGGDGAVRVWGVSGDGQPPQQLHVLTRPTGAGAGDADSGSDDDDDSCVHALALGADGLLFAGLQSGAVCVWDLETMQCIRTLAPAAGTAPSVFALLATGGLLYAGGADGRVRVWTTTDLQAAGHLESADAEDKSPVLALAGGSSSGGSGSGDCEVVVGGGDVGVWAVGWPDSHVPQQQQLEQLAVSSQQPQHDAAAPQDMLRTLGRWVQLRSVAGVPELQPECRRAALFLRDLLLQHGAADARLLAGAAGANPLVYARFDATAGGARGAAFAPDTPTVLVYGHYD